MGKNHKFGDPLRSIVSYTHRRPRLENKFKTVRKFAQPHAIKNSIEYVEIFYKSCPLIDLFAISFDIKNMLFQIPTEEYHKYIKHIPNIFDTQFTIEKDVISNLHTCTLLRTCTDI